MMMTTPRLGDNTMLLTNDAMSPSETLTPLGARSVTMMLRSGDDNNLGGITTQLCAHSVTTTPRLCVDASAMPLSDNPTPFGNDLTPLGARSATR